MKQTQPTPKELHYYVVLIVLCLFNSVLRYAYMGLFTLYSFGVYETLSLFIALSWVNFKNLIFNLVIAVLNQVQHTRNNKQNNISSRMNVNDISTLLPNFGKYLFNNKVIRLFYWITYWLLG